MITHFNQQNWLLYALFKLLTFTYVAVLVILKQKRVILIRWCMTAQMPLFITIIQCLNSDIIFGSEDKLQVQTFELEIFYFFLIYVWARAFHRPNAKIRIWGIHQFGSDLRAIEKFGCGSKSRVRPPPRPSPLQIRRAAKWPKLFQPDFLNAAGSVYHSVQFLPSS